MAQKREIQSYEDLYYWIDSMIMKYGYPKSRGLNKLKQFVKQKQISGWEWKDVAEWAVYSTSQRAGFNPFEMTQPLDQPHDKTAHKI